MIRQTAFIGTLIRILLADWILNITYTLVVQQVTAGFDPLFANPFIIVLASAMLVTIGCWIPFLVLFLIGYTVIPGSKHPKLYLLLLFICLNLLTILGYGILFTSDLSPGILAAPLIINAFNLLLFGLLCNARLFNKKLTIRISTTETTWRLTRKIIRFIGVVLIIFALIIRLFFEEFPITPVLIAIVLLIGALWP